jgi:voltage-gated potassium channel
MDSTQPRSRQQHVIICGFGRLGRVLAENLTSSGLEFVVVDNQPERLTHAESLGYQVCIGNATEERVLEAAGIKAAKILATSLPDDASNVFITLTARGLNPNLTIVARGMLPETEHKLRLAGADHVILPAAISALRLVNLITRPHALDFLDQSADRSHLMELMAELNVHIEELVIPTGSSLTGLAIEDIESKSRGALVVIALRKPDGKLHTHLQPTLIAEAGDTLIVVGHQAQIGVFNRQQTHKSEVMYRGRQL